MKITLMLSVFVLVSLTGCVNHYFNVSMDARVQELPDVGLMLTALKEDPEIVDVEQRAYPPQNGEGSLFDRVLGASKNYASYSLLIRATDGRSLQIVLITDHNNKSIGLFQQEWQNGNEFHDEELIRLMTDIYNRLKVRFPVLPPYEAVKKTIEHGSAH